MENKESEHLIFRELNGCNILLAERSHKIKIEYSRSARE